MYVGVACSECDLYAQLLWEVGFLISSESVVGEKA